MSKNLLVLLRGFAVRLQRYFRGQLFMRWIHLFSLFLFPAIVFSTISSDLNIGLRALQQIRTLIPERLTVEEFSIRVDRRSLKESVEKFTSSSMIDSNFSPISDFGSSYFYYSHWTISGEPVRILDFYQEFEYGPYWLYPTAMEQLWDLHHPKTPGNE